MPWTFAWPRLKKGMGYGSNEDSGVATDDALLLPPYTRSWLVVSSLLRLPAVLLTLMSWGVHPTVMLELRMEPRQRRSERRGEQWLRVAAVALALVPSTGAFLTHSPTPFDVR